MGLILGLMVIGALLGALIAWKRKGNKLDILQYAFVYMVLGAIIGLFAFIFIARSV